MSTTARAASSVARWAEAVPGVGPVTVDDLLTLPDDGYRYEVVDGVLVRRAGSGKRATIPASFLVSILWAYIRPRRPGSVTRADGVYRFPGAETGLLPDVGFYTAEREATIPDEADEQPIPFPPDLAVEVVSPDQTPEAMAAQARTYLRGGTRLVWIVWPQAQRIDIWHPTRLDGPVATLGPEDTLDREDVIPGFSYPVADVFADPLG